MDRELDVRGRPCPVPLVEAAKALAGLPPGAVLRVRGTDPALPADLATWCRATGYELLGLEHLGTEIVGRVRKRG